MRSIRAERDIHREDAAGLLLPDALEDALRARPLDPHRDAGIRRLERAAELLRKGQIERTIEGELALAARGLDQRGRDRGWWRRGRFDRLGEKGTGSQRRRCLQNMPS